MSIITSTNARQLFISPVHSRPPRLSGNSSTVPSSLLSLLALLFLFSAANLQQYSTDLDPRITSLLPHRTPPPSDVLDRVRQYVGIHKSLLGMTNSPKAWPGREGVGVGVAKETCCRKYEVIYMEMHRKSCVILRYE